MPEPIYNESCRDASLKAIITYKKPCPDCCECTAKSFKQQKGALKGKPLPKLIQISSKSKSKSKSKRKSRFKHKSKHKCCQKDQSCPQRIDQMALPLNRRIQYTLQRYSNVFDTERVIKVCRLIHELQNPQPRPPNLLKKKRKKKRCHRARACCKSAKLKKQWLQKQVHRSADKFTRYLGGLRRMIPNYKQLQVTMMIYKLLNFRKLRHCNRFVKDELKVICQKLAILIDVKLQPYKQEFVVDQISCTTLENKHCVFKMFKYVPPPSISAATEVICEYESTPSEVSFFAGGEELEIEEIEEEPWYSEEMPEEYQEEEEPSGIARRMRDFEGREEEEEITISGISLMEAQEGEEGLLEILPELTFEEESLYQESRFEEEPTLIEEEGAFPELEEEHLILEEEAVSIYEALPEEESEPSMLDYHPDGTSSYVDWCLYVSWLKELGRNIEMYASCLQQYRSALQADQGSKFTDTIKFILKNWSNYLGESRRVDQDMTEYFKDKVMTWCTMCRDCSIDDYPVEHYIPPELTEVIKSTKHWRRLLAEAEEYCNLLSIRAKEEEGAEEVEEEYEIHDVGSSSSSSFDIVPVDQPRKSRSRSK